MTERKGFLLVVGAGLVVILLVRLFPSDEQDGSAPVVAASTSGTSAPTAPVRDTAPSPAPPSADGALPATGAAPTSSPVIPTPLPTGTSRSEAPTLDGTQARDARRVAREFAVTWTRRDLAPDAWRQALAPLSTPRLRQQLQQVEPLSVPSTAPTPRNPGAVRSLADQLVEVRLDLGTGTLALTVLMRPSVAPTVDTIDWTAR